MASNLGPDTLTEIISAAAAVGATVVAVGQWIGVDFRSERRARQRYVDFLCKEVPPLGTRLAPLLNPEKDNPARQTSFDHAKDNTSQRVRFDAAVLIAAIVSISFLGLFGYVVLAPAVAYAAVGALFFALASDLGKLSSAQSSWNKVGDDIDAAIRRTDLNKQDVGKELSQTGILKRLEDALEGVARLLGGVKVDCVAICLGFFLLATAIFVTAPTGAVAWLELILFVALTPGAYFLATTGAEIYDRKARIQDSGYQVEAMQSRWIRARVCLAEGGVGFGPETISITGIGRYFEYETEGKYRTRVPWKRVWSLEVIPEMELPKESEAVASS